MSKHLQRDLEAIEHEILSVFALVEEMIGKACRALRERRPDLAREVIEADQDVDRREVHIEEECLKIVALHQPVAIDLRRTAAILKINNDVERIADLAVNIAERAERLDVEHGFRIPEKLERMSNVAIGMVREAIDAFVQLSANAARRVCASDDRVDGLQLEVTQELCARMKSDPTSIETSLHCYSAARDIERIADHATNIAEDVIYLVEGDIARHRRERLAPPGEKATTASR